ncbi:MAG TPA: transketolase [Solirubrobacterales bacterium]|jgi:transketolase|nr:transketolase [Solirubrobacterales bacterium]
MGQDIDQLAIDTIRTLSIDAVEKAKSGHPGTPMSMAPVAYELWQNHLRYDPADPVWPNRDRFVLSAGHASMLIYSVLHLAGVRRVDADYKVLDEPAVSLHEIEEFRQLHSRTPGHPEYRWTSGIETTTGPLGQGIATSVGMALASKWQTERFGADLFDFDVYALAGDGCLMEGVSHESASLAGHLKLDNLCWMYDNNHITIDGATDLAYGDDVLSRFEGYGWNVLRVGDANDAGLLARAFDEFKAEVGRPTLIVIDSHIGWGSPNKQDTESAHGEPLGEEEVKLTKRAYGWPEDAQFLVPDGVRERFDEKVGKRGAELRGAWGETLDSYRETNAGLAAEIEMMQRRQLPDDWDAAIPSFEADEEKGLATRKASNKIQNAIAERVPWMLSGSADLTDSTSVRLDFDGAVNFEPGSFNGRQIHFGIREHAAAAACSGLSLSKLKPLWSTYLTFSDYGRGAIRLSAQMELPVIHLFTHDSIGLGEDGPTHQPIEQLASLRAMPHLDVIRPADANEAAEAWRVAVNRTHNPVALILTRQTVPIFDRSRYASAAGLQKGGYVLADCEGEPELILIATGSEVQLALGAHETLIGEGIRSRVVSLPCWEIFERQDAEYRDQVLPPAVTARVAIEEASTLGWERYVGTAGAIIGMTTFGQSAPFADVEAEFGFTPDHVAEVAREVAKGATVNSSTT